MKLVKPMKLKSKYVIERTKEIDDEGTHILWYESETMHGSCYKRVFKGTYQDCLLEKEKREKNVSKPKGRSFRLLKKALYNQ